MATLAPKSSRSGTPCSTDVLRRRTPTHRRVGGCEAAAAVVTGITAPRQNPGTIQTPALSTPVTLFTRPARLKADQPTRSAAHRRRTDEPLDRLVTEQ